MKNYLIALISLILQNQLFIPAFAFKKCQPSVLMKQFDLTIKNGERRRGKDTIDDIEIAKVQWWPNLEKNQAYFEQYDLSKLELIIRKGDGEWEVFNPRKKVSYLGHYTWNVPRVPCLKYEYQIKVPSKSDETHFCTEIKSKPLDDRETIKNSGFKPQHPTHVEINTNSEQTTFLWDKSQCAEEYDVYVADMKQEDEKHKSVLQEHNTEKASVSFDGLQPCTNYLIEIYSKVTGGKTRDECLQRTFYTQPNINSASFLDLNRTTSNSNSATLSFFTYMEQINCLSNFTIETCKNDNCFQQKLLANTVSHEEKKYTSTGLDHCTKYSLKVKPTYQDVQIASKNVVVTTKFDDTAKKPTPNIKAGETSAKIIVKNVECFDLFTMSYKLIGNNDQNLEEAKIRNKGNSIFIHNLRPNSTYSIKMTASMDHDGQQFTIFDHQKFKTLPKTAPIPAIISKENVTDGSRSRVLRHYSENGSKKNEAVLQIIFGVTIFLIFQRKYVN